MKMICMTFNLRRDFIEDGDHAWSYRIQAVTEVIQRHQPLIIATQEGFYPMLEDLKQRLPDYSWIGWGRYGTNEDEHNAIYYKHDELSVVEQGQFWLSERPLEPGSSSWDASHPRICMWARFRSKVQTDIEFIIYNTHLDHESQLAREKGVSMILEAILEQRSKHKLPFLLMGDFNSEPDNTVITFLREQKNVLTDCYSAMEGYEGGTFHRFTGDTNCPLIDYIFVSSEVEVMQTEVIHGEVNGKYPSDHYPVVTRIQVMSPA